MARIPDEEIARLKRDVDLAALVRGAGVELRAHGDNLIGHCMFHSPDNTPSMVITKSTNLFHCFGCGAAGSVIDWVMKYEKASFRHAIEILRAASPSLAADLLAARAVDLNADDQSLVNEVVSYYHGHIAEARSYLASRGLEDEELIDHFHLGFSNRTLGYHLPDKQLKAGKESRARLIEIGLLRESGHEHFAGSLTIPVFDEAGNVTEIYGRKITTGLRKGTPLHMYLKGKHHGVWNWQGLVDSEEVILCEALIDALTIYKAGFANVTASYGVNGFTDDHLNALQRYGTKRVLIAYDRDEAGELGTQALAEKLNAAGITCARIEFPLGLDANEYARQYQPSQSQWRELIEMARPMGEVKPTMMSAGALNEAKTHEPAPAQPASKADVPVERKGEGLIVQLGDRRYRIHNLAHNLSYGQLKINLMCSRGDSFHMDTIDLCLHSHRKRFIDQAATELNIKADIIKHDLAKVLVKLEELQEELIRKALTPVETIIEMTAIARADALAFLSAPNLLERIIADYRRCGIVGEETNKLVGYLAAVSRKLDEPLAVIIQSSSAAGKTSLMEAVLEFMPAEQRVKYSAMTGQSLFYLGQKDLKHKILAIVEQEGAQQAAYALKLLQSEGELTIASTGKDANTGRLVTHEYKVEGPVMIFITTTAIEIDPELLNRCIVLTVNEGREQTRAIHQLQREKETIDGLWASDERKQIINLHQNAQRLLQPINVVNPYARALTFLDDQTRTRRDHTKYLKLIRSIALLHQYQRPIKTATRAGQSKQYIEVTIADIEIANRLASEVLGRTLDELPPQTRRLGCLLNEMVTAKCEQLAIAREDYRFTQRDVREYVGWSDAQVKVHLRKLVEMEYVLTHRGGRGQQFVYELLYQGEGQDGERFLMRLIDIAKLCATINTTYDEQWDGQKREWDEPGMGQGGIRDGRGSSGQIAVSAPIHAAMLTIDEETSKNAYIRGNGKIINHNHSHEEGSK